MKTTDTTTKQSSQASQANTAKGNGGGLALPAVPVLQAREAEGEEATQLMPYPHSSPRHENLQTKSQAPLQLKANNTGLPDDLKSGVENLSGMDLSDVKVHYNSSQPAQLNALAYAQGSNIHVAHGQEKHLPHEAWHVVQQKQGRVQATKQLKEGTAVNDNPALEREADVMGEKAVAQKASSAIASGNSHLPEQRASENVFQLLGIPGTHAKLATADYTDASGLIPGAGGSGPPPNIARTTVNTTIYDAGVARAPIQEGSTMRAYPISNRTRDGGSTTNAGVRAVSQAATAFYGRRYIAGHLLNSHLGGPGTDLNNITAFTAKSNSQHHAGIEKDLKADVSSGYIAYYSVDCHDRRNIAAPAGNDIDGLANRLVASYGLLESGKDANNPANYQTVRLLELTLDPGGADQVAMKDGQAMASGDVFLDHFIGKFANSNSDTEFADLVDNVALMDAAAAAQYLLANLASITDVADRAVVQSDLTAYLQNPH